MIILHRATTIFTSINIKQINNLKNKISKRKGKLVVVVVVWSIDEE